MDKTEENLRRDFKGASTRQLISLTELLGDELLRRAKDDPDPRKKRLYSLSAVNLVELRGRLRMVRAHELEHQVPIVETMENPSAAPAPTLGNSPETSGGVVIASTTAGAAESLVICSRCGHVMGEHRSATGCCMSSEGPEGLCECTGFVSRTDDLARKPAPTEPSELQRSGPRGPEAAEGASEAGRAKQGRGELGTDLAAHLALLKSGAA